MNAVKMAAIVLIAAGVLGLAYGSFSYTKDTHEAKGEAFVAQPPRSTALLSCHD